MSQTQATNRRADIQGLRAIAVFTVVCFHAGLPMPGGFAGVDVFFVISGFVITGMLLREHNSSGSIRLGNFYGRRFRRLTPALGFVVATVVIASFFIQSPLGSQWDTAVTGLGAMLLSANFVMSSISGGYFDAVASTNPLVNTWSLSVEEQFYLIFPGLLLVGLLLIKPRSRARHAPLIGVVVVSLVSFAAAMIYARGMVGPRTEWLIGFYGPLSRAWEFGAGAALALIVPRLRPPRFSLSLILGVLGLAMIAATMWLVGEQTRWPGPWTLLPVIGTLLLLAAGLGARTPISGVLGSRPFVAIGDLSYSWYLWHWPFIVFAALIWPHSGWAPKLAALASLGVAVGAYRWLEQPIRNLRGLSRKRMTVLVAFTLGIPISLALCLAVATQHGFWSSTVQEHQRALAPHLDEEAGCNEVVKNIASELPACVFNSAATGAPIYLLGDSNVGHFSEAALVAGQQLGRPLVISTTQGCPFIDTYMELESGASWWSSSDCRAYVDDRLAWLKQQPPGTVVISNDDSYWRQEGFAIGVDPNALTTDPDDRLRIYREALTKTVDAIESTGHHVVLVQTIPHFSWSPATCTMWEVWTGDCATSSPIPVEAKGVRDIVDSVAKATNAGVIDLQAYLCPDGTCRTEADGVVRYRDGGHLSVPASQALGDIFEGAIARSSTS